MQFARNPNAPPLRPREEQRQDQPHAYNQEAVLMLSELAYRALEFDQRAYRVGPVSYQDGVRIQGLQHRLKKLRATPADERSITENAALMREMADLGWLLIPIGWRKHVPFRRNPLRNASELALAWVLDFLAACRMMPSGLPRIVATPATRRRT